MVEPYVWGGLGRTVNDSTTIDQAISEALVAHSDDPDAHLSATGSLESHRDNPVVDHPAESVVNDKIKSSARAYAAIVDPSSESDYDTIESAVDYVKTLDGGTILIMPGTHYVSTIIELPITINMVGLDPDVTEIVTDGDNDKYFIAVATSAQNNDTMIFENLTFRTLSPYCFNGYPTSDYLYGAMSFTRCVFKGAGGYYHYGLGAGYFTECVFYLNTVGALTNWLDVVVTNCRFAWGGTSGVPIFIDPGDDGQMEFVRMQFCYSFGSFSNGVIWFNGGSFGGLVLTGNTLYGWRYTDFWGGGMRIVNNDFFLHAGHYLLYEGSDGVISGNIFTGGSGNRLRLSSGSSGTIVTGNVVGTAITNSGSGNVLANNITS